MPILQLPLFTTVMASVTITTDRIGIPPSTPRQQWVQRVIERIKQLVSLPGEVCFAPAITIDEAHPNINTFWMYLVGH